MRGHFRWGALVVLAAVCAAAGCAPAAAGAEAEQRAPATAGPAPSGTPEDPEARTIAALRAALLAAGSWSDAGDAAHAEASARRALGRRPSSPLAAALFEALASARAAQGDAPGARAAWREALDRHPEADREVAIRLALAGSLADAGQTAAAAAELRSVWVDWAERPESDTAGSRLAALEARVGHPLRTAADRLRRADHLFDAQRSEAALAAYEAALAGGLAPAERAHAQRRRADCLFRLRRYAEAEAAFAGLGRDPEARVWRARALARADRVEEAMEQLEAIGREGHGETSAWASLLAGLLHAGRGQSDQARVLFASAVDGGSPSVAAQALWQLGWSAYVAGESDTARRRFRALAALPGDPLERLCARYWAARALTPAEPEDARRELAAIAAEFPLSYYGWRARARLDAAPAATPAPLPDAASAIEPAALFAPRVLIAAGLREPGLRALDPLVARAASVGDRIAVAELAVAAGDYHRAQQIVVGAYGDQLARGIPPAQAELWRLAWPDAWPDVRRHALPPDAQIDPWLVASILREESGYQPDAVSVSGALGLLQLMPGTARRLARDAGLDGFEPAELVEPRVNLRLGSLYLDRLFRRFDGALEPAIASYNAGAAVVSGWLATGPAEPDAWVEAIPYDQTRGYVKRVLRSLAVYRALYR
jgi:soluble lytic murein transglycosylase